MSQTLHYLPLTDCASQFNPRKEVSPESLAELAESIRLHGVLQPIVVCPHPAPDPDTPPYLIVAGHRRHRAAQIACLQTIPATVRSGDGSLALVMISLAENLQRQELNPIEEAKCYRALMAHKMTQEQIASYLSKSQGYISSRVRLLSLPQEVQKKLAAGELMASHGRALKMKSNHGRTEQILQKAGGKKITLRLLEKCSAQLPGTGETPTAVQTSPICRADEYLGIALRALEGLRPRCAPDVQAELDTAVQALKACRSVL